MLEAKSLTIPLYIDSAQVYLQLALGLLVLTIAFRERVLAVPPGRRPGAPVLATWLCLFISIAANVLYQYVAIKHLASYGPVPGKQPWWLEPLIEDPGIVYGMVAVFFFLGAGLFVVSALIGLASRR